MTTDVTTLLEDFVSQEVRGLERQFGRALRDNTAGQAMLSAAIEQAVRVGIGAWSEIQGAVVGDVEWNGDDAQAAWLAQKQLTPEAERWPVRLGVSGSAGEAALEEAEAVLLAAGSELGMTGAVGGRRARAALADVGRQAAEAGASLAYALSREPEVEEPVVGTAAPERPVPAGVDAVHVATAMNLAECELIQNRLADAGIPSRWRHSAGDVPHFTPGGYRDVLVPPSAVEEARVLLATVEGPEPARPDRRAHPVGLERSSLRRFGKGAIVVGLTGGVAVPLLVDALAGGTWALLAAAAYVALAAAAVLWSDRSGARP